MELWCWSQGYFNHLTNGVVTYLKRRKKSNYLILVLSFEQTQMLTHTPRNIEPPHFPYSPSPATKNSLRLPSNSFNDRVRSRIFVSPAFTMTASIWICPCFAPCA